MRHYVRLQVSSLVTLCLCLVLTSALLTSLLTMRFSAPLERMARGMLLPIKGEVTSSGSRHDARVESLYVEPHFSGEFRKIMTSQPRTAGQEGNRSVLIRHPKKNDLDPQPVKPRKRFPHAGNVTDEDQILSRAPKCILMGFAKCGTSALLEFLDLHPKIISLDWEPDYFCDRMYQKYDLKWYVKRMPPSLPDQITIEKSPCYIVEHDAHHRIHAFNSSLKVLVLVRDPVTRLMSEHAHYASCQRYWGKTTQSFENRFYNNFTGQFKTEMILKVGDYTPHFQHLLQVFPRDQILIVDGDKLITNPLSQLSRIETFLGLQHEISREDLYFDREKGFYCMHLRQTGERRCMGKSKGRQHEQVNDQFKKKLANFLKPYKEKFFELVGDKFNWM
ncbi:heparan sulfate glucosamine 3-o-sulfotransferase 5-like [Plakobranchus ocellatus]|uniref:Heparan sulfate glucosamine 3-o-sulfotransferase 5-like n=1 Tax=Plakobranchus ocellatus TaxID=259542 RepID=A0AAV4DNB7_9GAST|nr:heparan sulfate glucosamine 3-o-sulfotransferase 5-like [Plakobranchus ocellatus]